MKPPIKVALALHVLALWMNSTLVTDNKYLRFKTKGLIKHDQILTNRS